MDDIIKVEDHYYILATSSRVDQRTRVLKDDDTFAVFDEAGDIRPIGVGEQGLYHAGTRYLSRVELRFGAAPSTVAQLDGQARRTNCWPSTSPTPTSAIDDNLVGAARRASPVPLEVPVSRRLLRATPRVELRAAAAGAVAGDDLRRGFRGHVRGARPAARAARPAACQRRVENGALVLAYEGLDGVTRRTRIDAVPAAAGRFPDRRCRFDLPLQPRASASLAITAHRARKAASRHVALVLRRCRTRRPR